MSDEHDVTAPVPGSDAEHDQAVSTLLEPLEGLDERPVAEHPAAYEQVHGRLRAALAGTSPQDAPTQA